MGTEGPMGAESAMCKCNLLGEKPFLYYLTLFAMAAAFTVVVLQST